MKLLAFDYSNQNYLIAKSDSDIEMITLSGIQARCDFVASNAFFITEEFDNYRPKLRLNGNIRSVDASFPYSVNSLYFESPIYAEFDYNFSNDEIKSLIDKGYYTENFEIPPEFTHTELELPIKCNISMIKMDNSKYPLAFVDMDVYDNEISREVCKYNFVDAFKEIDKRAYEFENVPLEYVEVEPSPYEKKEADFAVDMDMNMDFEEDIKDILAEEDKNFENLNTISDAKSLSNDKFIKELEKINTKSEHIKEDVFEVGSDINNSFENHEPEIVQMDPAEYEKLMQKRNNMNNLLNEIEDDADKTMKEVDNIMREIDEEKREEERLENEKLEKEKIENERIEKEKVEEEKIEKEKIEKEKLEEQRKEEEKKLEEINQAKLDEQRELEAIENERQKKAEEELSQESLNKDDDERLAVVNKALNDFYNSKYPQEEEKNDDYELDF